MTQGPGGEERARGGGEPWWHLRGVVVEAGFGLRAVSRGPNEHGVPPEEAGEVFKEDESGLR